MVKLEIASGTKFVPEALQFTLRETSVVPKVSPISAGLLTNDVGAPRDLPQHACKSTALWHHAMHTETMRVAYLRSPADLSV